MASIIRECLSLITLIVFLFSSYQGFRYDGFAMLDIQPQTMKDVDQIWEFAGKYRHDEINLQFVRPPYKETLKITVIVSPKVLGTLVTFLIDVSIAYRVVIQDYQRLIDAESSENKRAIRKGLFRSSARSDHRAFLRYAQMEAWIIGKVSKVQYAQFSRFGETHEKRKIFMVKISKNSSLPIVWLDGCIHAREWISSSSVLYVLDMLLQNSSEANDALQRFQFMIVPLLNPDGYEYSHETYRLWRKNRSQSPSSRCVGVDLNRNFPFHWGGKSASEYPCNEQYRGQNYSSEKEIQALTDQMTKVMKRLKLVLSIHSFGQYILQPYHYGPDDFPRNYLEMTSVAMRAAFEVQSKHGSLYMVGRAPDILYAASGSSDDFVVGILKVPFSFTIELPDKGDHGFCLPPRFIKTVGSELWEIVKTLTTEISQTSSYD